MNLILNPSFLHRNFVASTYDMLVSFGTLCQAILQRFEFLVLKQLFDHFQLAAEINHPGQGGEEAGPGGRRPPGRWISWEPTLWVLIGMAVSFVPHMMLEGSHPH